MLDARLRPLAMASAPVASSFPAPGWVEHDPAQLVTSVLASMRAALESAGAGWTEVAAIGLAAQTETFVVWDRATGAAVYPAISWRDGRAAAACDRLRAAGRADRIRALTGLPIGPAFSAAKLRWLLDEIPGGQRRAAAGELAFGDVGCWLTWQLSGGTAHVTEPSMAARTMLFGLAAGDWSAELLAEFGIPAALLPRLGPTAGRLAVTDPAVCGGRAVIGASIGDQPAALFGQRCWTAGEAKLTLGTGAFLWCHAGPAPPAAVPDGVVSSCAWRLAGETAYALEGFVPNAGGVTTWLRQIGALAPDAFPVITDSAAGASPADDAAETGRGSGGAGGAGGLWCVPALFGLGTPHWTAAAAADVTGLTPASTAADLAQAAMLGVVHQIADAIDAVRPGLPGPLRLVRADGGLAGNDSVLQAIADLAGISLERSAVTEATALGAGALAGLGTGLWDRAGLAAMAFEAGPAVQPALPPSRRAEARYGWSCALAGAMSRWQQTAQEAGR